MLSSWAPKPADTPFEVAAGLGVPGETAVRVLDILDLQPGQTVVVDGASGGVGVATVQVALARGSRSSAPRARRTRTSSARSARCPPGTAPAWPTGCGHWPPAAVHGGVDTAGKGSVRDLIELTGDPARVVTIADFGAGDLGVHVTSGGGGQPARLAQIAGLLADGRLRMPVAGSYPLDRIGDAYAESAGGHVRGKLVLLP